MLHTTTPAPTLAQALVAWWFRLFLAVVEPWIAPRPAARRQATARSIPARPTAPAQRLYPIPPERAHLYARAADEGWD